MTSDRPSCVLRKRTCRVRPLLLSALMGVAACTTAFADRLILKGGKVVEGTIVRKERGRVSIKYEYGIGSYAIEDIQSIEDRQGKREAQLTDAVEPGKIPSWRLVYDMLAGLSWAKDIDQIPSTVIDKGVLKNVPYISFKVEPDYEVNVYGDLDRPAGVEIGVYRKLLNDPVAKSNCIAFISQILADPRDKKRLEEMDKKKGVSERDGMTIEITPPEGEDSYGGWWVSLYRMRDLDSVRATDKELKDISVSAKPAPNDGRPSDETLWSNKELSNARIASPKSEEADDTARLSSSTATRSHSSSPSVSGSSGRVYVRGYYRKDGTYVKAHTRSMPRR